uniref:glutathione transferase n=1 Tax=Romanomermis culicivorax TaxID=13658 RepID=A0A915HSH2_ROMCU
MICCKLYHFSIRMNAECIRYLFAFLFVPFEDFRIDSEHWNTNELANDVPFGKLPMLQYDGRNITGTLTIARFLANQYNLTPKTNYDQALADMYAEAVMDLSDRLTPVNRAGIFLKDQKRKVIEWERFKRYHLSGTFSYIEKRLTKGEWLCGQKKVSWADFVLAEFSDRINTLYDKTALDVFPNIKDHMKRIHSIPSIKVYTEHRTETDH